MSMLQSIIGFARSTVGSPAESGKDYIFPSVNPETDGPDCNHDCADCTVKYPSSMKINNHTSLYGSLKPFGTHVLVATGKSDWIRKVEHEQGSLMEAFKQTSSKSKQGRIMVSASNISPHRDSDDTSEDATTVLVLPSFTYVDNVTTASIPDFIEHYVDEKPASQNGHLQSPEADGRLISRPCSLDYAILLCSHRTRDARCGISAPLIKTELERHLRRQNLLRDQDDSRPGGAGIFFVSHVGGHKVAANVLVYRRQAEQMIWLARIRPEHCEGIVKHTILEGKVVHPEQRLRGGVDWKKGAMSW